MMRVVDGSVDVSNRFCMHLYVPYLPLLAVCALFCVSVCVCAVLCEISCESLHECAGL